MRTAIGPILLLLLFLSGPVGCARSTVGQVSAVYGSPMIESPRGSSHAARVAGDLVLEDELVTGIGDGVAVLLNSDIVVRLGHRSRVVIQEVNQHGMTRIRLIEGTIEMFVLNPTGQGLTQTSDTAPRERPLLLDDLGEEQRRVQIVTPSNTEMGSLNTVLLVSATRDPTGSWEEYVACERETTTYESKVHVSHPNRGKVIVKKGEDLLYYGNSGEPFPPTHEIRPELLSPRLAAFPLLAATAAKATADLVAREYHRDQLRRDIFREASFQYRLRSIFPHVK